jgi:mono/diheme cytochrome c family protein
MSRFLLSGCVLLTALMALAQGGKHNLGRVPAPEELKTGDISVLPTGAGLPPGEGSARQGRSIYVARCANCHGEHGEGRRENPPLAGGLGTLKSDAAQATVGSYWPYATTVWDYINRAMPYQDPGSLGPREVYSVTAYVLYLNGIVSETEVLNAKTLPKVKMPNRDGFVPDPRPDTKTLKR